MDYKNKYLKYKLKYLELKKQEGGMDFVRKKLGFTRPPIIKEKFLEYKVFKDENDTLIVTLPKGSRLYKSINNDTKFFTSPIACLSFGWKVDPKDKCFIITLTSDVSFYYGDKSKGNYFTIHPTGRLFVYKHIDLLKSLNVSFQSFIINNPGNHDIKKSSYKIGEFGSLFDFFLKCNNKLILSGDDNIRLINMKFTKLQYEKYKNFKNNKLNIVDDDFFGYSRYKYTSNKYENSIQNDEMKLIVKRLEEISKKSKKILNKKIIQSIENNIIDDNKSEDHNLPLWIRIHSYRILNDKEMRKKLKYRSIDIKEFKTILDNNMKKYQLSLNLINNYINEEISKEYSLYKVGNFEGEREYSLREYSNEIEEERKKYIYEKIIKKLTSLSYFKKIQEIFEEDLGFEFSKPLDYLNTQAVIAKNYSINDNIKLFLSGNYYSDSKGNKYFRNENLEKFLDNARKIYRNSQIQERDIRIIEYFIDVIHEQDLRKKSLVKEYFKKENEITRKNMILKLYRLEDKKTFKDNEHNIDREIERINKLEEEKSNFEPIVLGTIFSGKWEDYKVLHFLKSFIKKYYKDNMDMVNIFRKLIEKTSIEYNVRL